MFTEKENYKKYVEQRATPSPIFKDCCFAFLIGGCICVIGQLLLDLYKSIGMEKTDASSLVSVTLVFITAILTGIGIFDEIARFAGAGTLVPITGFANAVVSCAIDTKSEGYILGVGAKIFTIAGPVILYGTFCGTVYGVIYYLATLIWG